MKTILFLLLLSMNAQAIELKFIGPCLEDFVMKVDVQEDYPNVGELTIKTLEKFNVPHQGTIRGLNSVFNTPVGQDALEVLSDTEMRAYGWCYSVDGEAPEVFPHEFILTPEMKNVTWHFGFALYKNGQWITQCTPSYSVKPAFLCEDNSLPERK